MHSLSTFRSLRLALRRARTRAWIASRSQVCQQYPRTLLAEVLPEKLRGMFLCVRVVLSCLSRLPDAQIWRKGLLDLAWAFVTNSEILVQTILRGRTSVEYTSSLGQHTLHSGISPFRRSDCKLISRVLRENPIPCNSRIIVFRHTVHGQYSQNAGTYSDGRRAVQKMPEIHCCEKPTKLFLEPVSCLS